MGMSSYILDREEQFWDKANTVIGECEHFYEFVAHMKKHRIYYRAQVMRIILKTLLR